MATIRDVAKRAGVAPITVSRVINNSGYFSEAARASVEAAIAELGYVPNRLARGLRQKRTHTLALVLTDITNPFFTTVARGVEDIANEAGYTVTYCNSDESLEKEQKYLDLLVQQQVDGILLVPTADTPENIRFLQKNNTPVVIMDRHVVDAQADIVRCDSEAGAYQLVQLLLELGHRQIAMLGGPEGISTAADRLAGYQRALSGAGVTPSSTLVQSGAFTQQSGYQMAREVLSATPQPTALLAANNFIAIGAVRAVQEFGLSVPDDIALVGFDDLPPALTMFPFLTVAAQPACEMAHQATKLLLSRLAGEGPVQWQEIVLPTELVLRQSSGKPISAT